jgi:hypothetical protein
MPQINLQDTFLETLDRIDQMEYLGELDEEEAVQSRLLANEEYRELMANYARNGSVANFEFDDAGMEGDEMMTFVPETEFGEALIKAIEMTYEVPEEAVLDIAEGTEYDPEDVIEMLTGDLIPDGELALEIAAILGLDEEQASILVALAEEEIEAALEEDEYDDEYDDEMMDEEYEGEIDEGEAEYAAALQILEMKNRELEAKFAQAETEKRLNNVLIQQQLHAQSGVDEGWLPPAILRAEFGDFATDDDRLATFSTTCKKNQVDIETELYARDKILAAFSRLGPIMNFGRIADEALDDPDPEDEFVDQVASSYSRRLLAQRHQRNGTSSSNN